MNDKDLKEVLLKIKSGDNEMLVLILNMYEGLIKKSSYINGVFDEDCKSFITERLMKELKNKKIDIF